MKKATECEMSVIGALLCSDNDEALQTAFSRISPKAFSDESLQEIYKAIVKVWQETGKTDCVLILKALPEEYRARIPICMDLVPAPSLLPHYTAMLMDQYRRRVLSEDLTKLAGALREEVPTEEVLRDLNRAAEVQQKLAQVQKSTSMDMLGSIIEYLNSLYRADEQPIKTGFAPFDKAVGGLPPKSVNIISGRSGMGTSDFAIFLAVKLAVQGVRVLYLSMEMPRTQIMARIASRVAMIDSRKLYDAKSLTPEERNTVSTLLERISKIPLILDEQQALTTADVAAKIRKHRPQVIVVDHMQLMARESNYRQSWENLAETSRAMKRLAMNENVILIELVQQNADIEKRGDKTPRMSDVKGTDGYTNDADTLMFIQADRSADAMNSGESVDVRLFIAKNRNGSVGQLPFRWQPQFHRYLALSRLEE